MDFLKLVSVLGLQSWHPTFLLIFSPKWTKPDPVMFFCLSGRGIPADWLSPYEETDWTELSSSACGHDLLASYSILFLSLSDCLVPCAHSLHHLGHGQSMFTPRLSTWSCLSQKIASICLDITSSAHTIFALDLITRLYKAHHCCRSFHLVALFLLVPLPHQNSLNIISSIACVSRSSPIKKKCLRVQ